MSKLHTVSNDTTQNVISMSGRPEWAEPKLDRDGNITGWTASPALLCKKIIEDNDLLAGVDQGGQTHFYIYNGDYWEAIDYEGMRNLIAGYFTDTDTCKCFDLYNNRTVLDTIGLLKGKIYRDSFSNTFDNESVSRLGYIPFDYFDYNIYSLQNERHSPERFFTYKRDYDLVDGQAESTNKWLLESLAGDEEQLALLKIFIGASFYRSYEPLQFILFIVGDGGEGKSTFFRYWQSLIGDTATSHLSFDQIVRTGTNFALSELYHKELNVFDDVNASYITSSMMGTPKQLTGGNAFDAEVKNKGNVRFANYASLVFGANEMPEIQGLGYAEKRRMYIFKWQRIEAFESKYNKTTIYDERGAFAKQCIDAFTEVLAKRTVQGLSQAEALPYSSAIEQNWNEFQLDSDPVARFIFVRCKIDASGKKNFHIPKSKLFEEFEKWADRKKLGVKDMTERKFNKRVRRLGYKESVAKVGGSSTRVWTNIQLRPLDEELEL